jgi:hypothetical protein
MRLYWWNSIRLSNAIVPDLSSFDSHSRIIRFGLLPIPAIVLLGDFNFSKFIYNPHDDFGSFLIPFLVLSAFCSSFFHVAFSSIPFSPPNDPFSSAGLRSAYSFEECTGGVCCNVLVRRLILSGHLWFFSFGFFLISWFSSMRLFWRNSIRLPSAIVPDLSLFGSHSEIIRFGKFPIPAIVLFGDFNF